MNICRAYHSATFLADTLYVFGGIDRKNLPTNSIEFLRVSETGYACTYWKSLNVPDTVLGRTNPVFCPVNANQIVIIGGAGPDDALKDVHVFDMSKIDSDLKAHVSLVTEDSGIACFGGANAQFDGKSGLASLLLDDKMNLKMIHYCQGSQKLTTICDYGPSTNEEDSDEFSD